jgi:hypothetical protein
MYDWFSASVTGLVAGSTDFATDHGQLRRHVVLAVLLTLKSRHATVTVALAV